MEDAKARFVVLSNRASSVGGALGPPGSSDRTVSMVAGESRLERRRFPARSSMSDSAVIRGSWSDEAIDGVLHGMVSGDGFQMRCCLSTDR
jgi:hypothetical protein